MIRIPARPHYPPGAWAAIRKPLRGLAALTAGYEAMAVLNQLFTPHVPYYDWATPLAGAGTLAIGILYGSWRMHGRCHGHRWTVILGGERTGVPCRASCAALTVSMAGPVKFVSCRLCGVLNIEEVPAGEHSPR